MTSSKVTVSTAKGPSDKVYRAGRGGCLSNAAVQ